MTETTKPKKPKVQRLNSPNRIDRAAAAASQLYPPLAELDREALKSLCNFLLGPTTPPAAAGVNFLHRRFKIDLPKSVENMTAFYGALDIMRLMLQTIDRIKEMQKARSNTDVRKKQEFWSGEQGFQTVPPAMSPKTGFRVR